LQPLVAEELLPPPGTDPFGQQKDSGHAEKAEVSWSEEHRTKARFRLPRVPPY